MGPGRFREQNFQGRNGAVPLDTGGDRREEFHCLGIEIPHWLGDGAAVRVHQVVVAIIVARQVNLPDPLRGQGGQELPGVVAVVEGIDVQVVDVEKKQACLLYTSPSPRDRG